MAKKPETGFIERVNKGLPIKLGKTFVKARALFDEADWVHYEKMANPYRGGTADSYYSGRHNDLWVEYKYLACVPQRASVWPANPNQSLLSSLQLAWLEGRLDEGRNIAVIIGCPSGGVVLVDREWRKEMVAEEFVSLIRSVSEISDWIHGQTVLTR